MDSGTAEGDAASAVASSSMFIVSVASPLEAGKEESDTLCAPWPAPQPVSRIAASKTAVITHNCGTSNTCAASTQTSSG
ncbi:hypothetical protein SDC9_145067 [bioreactor metagenome]|uniref:Uncharacterized protein n=1 Tax=bioreactor metagenome TaxID=1076179 RepID=A0A645E7Q0_9ZZZZ